MIVRESGVALIKGRPARDLLILTRGVIKNSQEANALAKTRSNIVFRHKG